MMGPYLATVESVLEEALSARFTDALPELARASEPAGIVHAGAGSAGGVAAEADVMAEADVTAEADEGVVDNADVGVDAEDEDEDEPSKRLMISCGASSVGLFSRSSARTVAKSAAACSVTVSARS